MTLRERIADWISGGALSRALSKADAAERERVDIQKSMYRLVQSQGESEKYITTRWHRRTDAFRRILNEADRDPSRPSIKRIARIAKEALE